MSSKTGPILCVPIMDFYGLMEGNETEDSVSKMRGVCYEWFKKVACMNVTFLYIGSFNELSYPLISFF